MSYGCRYHGNLRVSFTCQYQLMHDDDRTVGGTSRGEDERARWAKKKRKKKKKSPKKRRVSKKSSPGAGYLQHKRIRPSRSLPPLSNLPRPPLGLSAFAFAPRSRKERKNTKEREEATTATRYTRKPRTNAAGLCLTDILFFFVVDVVFNSAATIEKKRRKKQEERDEPPGHLNMACRSLAGFQLVSMSTTRLAATRLMPMLPALVESRNTPARVLVGRLNLVMRSCLRSYTCDCVCVLVIVLTSGGGGCRGAKETSHNHNEKYRKKKKDRKPGPE